MGVDDIRRTLLNRIVEAPDDDELRLVYADCLLESGDLRGELIQLQLRPTPTRGELDRIVALRTAHESRWLGPVGRVTSKRVWSRGFLVEATITSRKKQDFRAAMNHDAWALVTTIRLEEANQSITRPLIELITDPAFRSLRSIRDGRVDVVRELVGFDGLDDDGDGPLSSIDTLDIALDQRADAEEAYGALGGDGMRNLRELSISGLPMDRAETVMETSVGRRVEVISLATSTPRLVTWFKCLESASATLREVNVRWAKTSYVNPTGWTLTFHRDETNSWSVLKVRGAAEDTTRFARPLAGFINELPPNTLSRFELQLAGETRFHLMYFGPLERALSTQRRLIGGGTGENLIVPYDRALLALVEEEDDDAY